MKDIILSSPKEFMAYMERSRQAIANALPPHLNADRMMRIALTCFSQTPKLRECTGQSIAGAIIVASQLGLEPGINGQGYLVPYKTKQGSVCTFVPGWQGLVGLVNNTGRATVWTGAVFEGDEWDLELGSNPRCQHRPGPNYGDESMMTWVYACGKVNGAELPIIDAWPMSRVWKHRDKHNKVGNSHYSFVYPEMYARKCVVLQVLKYLPRSVAIDNALAASYAGERGRPMVVDHGVIMEITSEEEEQPDMVSKPAVSEADPKKGAAARGNLEKHMKGEGWAEDDFIAALNTLQLSQANAIAMIPHHEAIAIDADFSKVRSDIKALWAKEEV